MERKTYEVVVENGKLLFLQTGELLDTTGGLKDDKWIFVLSTSKTLYVGKKKKGTFQHSSFLAGGATMSAGRLVVENGILKVYTVCYFSLEFWIYSNFNYFLWPSLNGFYNDILLLLNRQFGLTVAITSRQKKISRISSHFSWRTMWIFARSR